MRYLASFLILLAGVGLWAGETKPGVGIHHAELVRAVEQRHVIAFTYADERLEAEPHAYGLSAQEQPLLRAYVATPSAAGEGQAAWLLFRVDRIAELEVRPSTFNEARPGYHKGDKAMRVIFAEY